MNIQAIVKTFILSIVNNQFNSSYLPAYYIKQALDKLNYELSQEELKSVEKECLYELHNYKVTIELYGFEDAKSSFIDWYTYRV